MNMQNLPRADEDDDGAVKSKVKEMYVSRFEGGHIVQVDYTALEVVMQAALTGDTDLLAQLQAGTDMHCYRLAPTLSLTYEETRAIYKDSSHPDHFKVARLRTAIKPRAFAAQYGASAMGIAYATGCTVEEAQEFLDNEAKLFPISIGYRDIVRAEVERTGMQAGNLHREMQPDGTWGLYRRGYFRTPGGTRYSFRQYLRWCNVQRKRVMDYKDTQLANYWCQGEAFFVMAVAAGLVIRWLINNDFLGGKAYLINNVHDALFMDCHPDVTKQVAEKVKELMEYAPKHMSYLGYDIADVPFPAVPVWGHNMLQEFNLDELE